MQCREQVSAREAEVLAAIRGHQSNARIAARLHLSVRTVESHVSSLLRKAGVPDRRSLAALADASAGDRGLPAYPTSFAGRAHERAEVSAALRDSRLVSLVGPGGVGKARLAVEVAADLDGGAAFVALVPVRAGEVARTVAQVLGVTERPPGTPADAVIDRLRSAPAMLVLDNCEHVIDEAGALIARILRSCPHTTILATSRERLAVPGQRLLVVPPLGSEAQRLFLDRARAVGPDLLAERAVVARLCTALDGMPLAIEWVAARTASLGVDGVHAAPDDRLRLVSGGRGPDQRHHSLATVIGWSLDLLDDEERVLFRRLGMFVGGFDLDAVTALDPECGVGAIADLVGRLVDRSLVVPGRPGAGARWSLPATVRAVARRELAAGGEDIRPRYVRWAADTVARMETRIGRLTSAEFDAVADDLRHARASATEGDTAYRLAKALARLSFGRGHVVAAREHYRTAADLAPDPAAAAGDLGTAAAVALTVADGETAFGLLLATADRAGQAGENAARAVPLGSAVITATRFAMCFTEQVPRDRVVALLEEATALTDPADERAPAVVATARAWAAGRRPLEPDLELSRAAVAAARRTGDAALVLGALDALGTALANAGRLRRAHRLSDELAVVAGLPDAARRLADAEPAAAENDWAAACLARATARHTGDRRLLTESVARWERIDARFERAVTLVLMPDRAAEGHAEPADLKATPPAPSSVQR
ncbi:LuxR C-terminal-related transcriptional regulator [Streptomyces sp. B8F3]|uniref:ATP-binding protein n=1 Tax=Streptomyces sp. B8F3 TaxID=3153573 RepID=UPI00325D14EB